MVCAGLMLLWLLVAWPMKAPGRNAPAPASNPHPLGRQAS
jgi:hypothetical protein